MKIDLKALAAEVEAARKEESSYCAELAAQKWIRVMSDYCAGGVWDKDGCATLPEYLPIDVSLIARIRRWQEDYDCSDGWAEPSGEATFEDWGHEGLLIAIEMKRQLPDWTVLYHDDRRSIPRIKGLEWQEFSDRLRPWFEYEITDKVMRTGLAPDNYPSDLPAL